MIHRLLEEALHLRRMQIHEDHTIHADLLDAVRTHACADGNAGLILLVALGIGKIRNDSRYGVSAGAFEGVDPKQKLCKLVVGFRTDGLHDVYVLVANGLVDANKDVAFGEHDGLCIPKLRTKIAAHPLCKRASRAPRIDLNDACACIHNNLTYRTSTRIITRKKALGNLSCRITDVPKNIFPIFQMLCCFCAYAVLFS